MKGCLFSIMSGISVILASLPMMIFADNWEARQRAAIDRQEQKAGLDNGYYYDPYGYYGYPAATYGPYGNYPNPYNYPYPGYMPYYYNPGMYNPNTNFVNPPSSLNYPKGYPIYSETYPY